jgi:hypothetical protein
MTGPRRFIDLFSESMWSIVFSAHNVFVIRPLSISRPGDIVFRIVLAVAGLWVSTPAVAYLDPGTGSMLLQSLIGILAVGAAAVGTFFGRIRALFTRKKPPDVAGEGGASRER